MSLRKKKVEDALSKLFSSSKPQNPITQSPLKEPIEASPLELATESEKPRRRVKPSPEITSTSTQYKESATRENRPEKDQSVEEAQAQTKGAVPPVIEPEISQPITTLSIPSAETQPISAKTSGNQENSVISDPSTPRAAAVKKISGDGSSIAVEDELPSRHELATEEICQLVIFTLAGEAFGLPIDRVESIIKPQAITVVPHARPYVVGVTNLRGTVLPVIDLRRRFQLPPGEKSDDQRIMVVLLNEEKIGLQVDSVTQVLRVPFSAIEPPPPIVTAFVHSAFVTGIAKVDERLVILLDLEKVLLPHNGN